MGITDKSLDRIRRHRSLVGRYMLELGAQNMYTPVTHWLVAKDYFENTVGIEHVSWDIMPHQGAIAMDLREEIPVERLYDIITDFGTTEHINGNLWQAFKNIHNHCKLGGLMIHENPKTGNWPEHGCNYYTQNFYIKLAEMANYEIVELTEEAAMGNHTDGWNICCVLRKIYDSPFISKEQFETLDYRTS